MGDGVAEGGESMAMEGGASADPGSLKRRMIIFQENLISIKSNAILYFSISHRTKLAYVFSGLLCINDPQAPHAHVLI